MGGGGGGRGRGGRGTWGVGRGAWDVRRGGVWRGARLGPVTSGAELVDQAAQLRLLGLGPPRDLTRLLPLTLRLEVQHAVHLLGALLLVDEARVRQRRLGAQDQG